MLHKETKVLWMNMKNRLSYVFSTNFDHQKVIATENFLRPWRDHFHRNHCQHQLSISFLYDEIYIMKNEPNLFLRLLLSWFRCCRTFFRIIRRSTRYCRWTRCSFTIRNKLNSIVLLVQLSLRPLKND